MQKNALSLPRELSADAKMGDWAQRVLLPPVAASGAESVPPPAPSHAPDIDVPVDRLPDNEE